MKINSDSEFLKIVYDSYDNPIKTSQIELDTDIRRFVYLNTAITRFKTDNNLNRLRVATNHLVIISNCFGVNNVEKMVLYKINPENIIYVNTIMVYLKIIESNNTDIKLLELLEDM